MSVAVATVRSLAGGSGREEVQEASRVFSLQRRDCHGDRRINSVGRWSVMKWWANGAESTRMRSGAGASDFGGRARI